MNNGAIVLKAEILHKGKGCPVCGGEKTELARTCRSCSERIGHEVTAAVDEIAALTVAAAEAHKLANAGNVRREVIFGPVLAQTWMNRNAELKTPVQPAENVVKGPMGLLNSLAVGGAGKGIASYFSMPKSVSGGILNLYVFGATEADKGKEITVLVELKTKQTKSGLVHYLRAEKVDAVKSNAHLCIQRINDFTGYLGNLPCSDIRDLIAKPGQSWKHTQPRERLIECSVGFKAVQEVALPEGVTLNGEKKYKEVVTA